MVAPLGNLYATINILQPVRLVRMRWNSMLAWVAAGLAVVPRVFAAASVVHTDSRGDRVVIRIPMWRAVIFEFYEVALALHSWDSVATTGSTACRNDLMSAAHPGIVAEIPDVIFLWNGAHGGVKDILDSSQWRLVEAVREGKAYRQPAVSAWSPRLAPLVLRMTKKIYPDLYRDSSIVSLTDQFCRNVLGIFYLKAAFDDL